MLHRIDRGGAVMAASLAVAAAAGAARADVTPGQVDTFESGTLAGWGIGSGGHPVPPAVVTGGPGGASDRYLRITSLGGFGAGSRLTVFNQAQWAGNYTAAGVPALTMDVINFGPDAVSLRLGFIDLAGGTTANFAISAAVQVPSGSGWRRVTFAIDAASLTAIEGTAAGALAGVNELRLFHNPAPGFPPPPVVAVVGVDNITAVPAPGGVMLALAGGWIARRRRPARA